MCAPRILPRVASMASFVPSKRTSASIVGDRRPAVGVVERRALPLERDQELAAAGCWRTGNSARSPASAIRTSLAVPFFSALRSQSRTLRVERERHVAVQMLDARRASAAP